MSMQSVTGLLVLMFAVLPVKLHAEEKTGSVEAGFVGTPPKALMVSERGTLRWTELRGDRRFQHGEGVEWIAIGANGTRIVSIGRESDARVKVWEASTGCEVTTIDPVDPETRIGVAALVTIPQGEHAVVATPEGMVTIIDLEHGKVVRRFERPCRGTSNLAVDAAGRSIAAACVQDRERVVTVHDLETGTLRHVLRGARDALIKSVGLSANGHRVCAWTSGGQLLIWDAASGKLLRMWKPPKMVFNAEVSPDGQWLVVTDEGLTLYDTETGKVRFSVAAPTYRKDGDVLSGQPDSFLRAYFDPLGRWVASTHLHGSALRVWDLETSRLLQKVPLPARAEAAAVSPDGAWIAAGDYHGTIRRIDPLKGTRLDDFTSDRGAIATILADEKGTRTVSIDDDEMSVWDESRGTILHRLHHRESEDDRGISVAAMSPDGRWIVSAGSGITLWDGTTGKAIRTIAGRRNQSGVARGFFGSHDTISTVALDPLGRWLAAGPHLGPTLIYDVRTGKPTYTLPWRGGMTSLAAAPDGTWLLAFAVGERPGIRLLDPLKGKILHTMATPGASSPPLVAMSPTGRWFAAAVTEGVSIYSIAARRKVRTLEDSEGWWRALAVASDGPYVFAADARRLLVWSSETGALLDTIAIDAPALGLVVRGDRVWLALGNGTTQIYRHVPAAR